MLKGCLNLLINLELDHLKIDHRVDLKNQYQQDKNVAPSIKKFIFLPLLTNSNFFTKPLKIVFLILNQDGQED